VSTKPDAGPHPSPLSAFKPEPLYAQVPAERRDLAARSALLGRVRGEFFDMPGLSLTLEQASRLFDLSGDACARILQQLAQEGLVRVTVEQRDVLHARASSKLLDEPVTAVRSRYVATNVRPPQGDVLIALDTERRAGYVISVVPGPAQVRCATYTEAIAAARAFAGSHPDASVWTTEDGETFAALL